MRVLFVSHGLPPWARAGTENYTHYLSRALATAGHDVAILYRRNEPDLPDFQPIEEVRDGVRLFGVNNTLSHVTTYESSYRNGAIDEIFLRVVREWKPQIVDIQHLNFLSTGIVEHAHKLGLPLVMTLHDYAFLCPTGQFVKADATPCAAQVDEECSACLGGQLTATAGTRTAHGLARKLFPADGAVLKALARLNRTRGARAAVQAVRARQEHMVRIAGLIERFLSPSAYLRERLSCILDGAKIEVSELGYNYDGSDAPRVPGEAVRFGFIGTVAPWKGLDTLLEAYRQVGSDRCRVHAHGRLLDVPDRPDYPARIRRLVAETGATYSGEYDQTQVYDLLARTDVLVVPSTSAENSPLTIHEARAARVPVIGSRIGGIPEFVTDGVTGLLVEPGDVDALAEAMSRFVNRPELVEQMRADIPRPRTIEDDARHHADIYNELLK